MMPNSVRLAVQANSDDALLVWALEPLPDKVIGFKILRKDLKTGTVVTLNNRIPASQAGGPVSPDGLSAEVSPFRCFRWIDHEVAFQDQVAYCVVPMQNQGQGFGALDDLASAWSDPVAVTSDAGNGMSAYFNRGLLMSQIGTRLMNGNVTAAGLAAFKKQLAQAGSPARRYLSGDARHAILTFLADADGRGSSIKAAIYEINDTELVQALAAFGPRCEILIGNGGATDDKSVEALANASCQVSYRDLSHGAGSSPSVHNKFVVEIDAHKRPVRVVTGSLNWTVTGLCTQLNNVVILERPASAERFAQQWALLKGGGDDMTPELLEANASAFTDPDGDIQLRFAATTDQSDLKAVVELVNGARQGILFEMFQPGESPILAAILNRVAAADGLYVRGVVSTVVKTANGEIQSHKGQVVLSGAPGGAFNDEAVIPNGAPASNLPPWELAEVNRQAFLSQNLFAIVHSKAVVIDPLSDDPVLITGSHNFSVSASAKNDENLLIVRGNKALALLYAVNMEGVHDHFAWRAFLNDGGDPARLYRPLKDVAADPKTQETQRFWLT